jgi:hypothetical protein
LVLLLDNIGIGYLINSSPISPTARQLFHLLYNRFIKYSIIATSTAATRSSKETLVVIFISPIVQYFKILTYFAPPVKFRIKVKKAILPIRRPIVSKRSSFTRSDRHQQQTRFPSSFQK